MSTKATNFVPQSEASKAASNAAFKRFAVRLTDLHKEKQEEIAAKEKGAK